VFLKIVDWFIDKVVFEVLTAASMKMAVFWVVAPCCLIEVTDFSGVLYLYNDGGDTKLWNVGKLFPDNAALQPRREISSIYWSIRNYAVWISEDIKRRMKWEDSRMLGT
jgi:hypothetical protein